MSSTSIVGIKGKHSYRFFIFAELSLKSSYIILFHVINVREIGNVKLSFCVFFTSFVNHVNQIVNFLLQILNIRNFLWTMQTTMPTYSAGTFLFIKHNPRCIILRLTVNKLLHIIFNLVINSLIKKYYYESLVSATLSTVICYICYITLCLSFN